jgi:outer membrane lipoprotein-sorting protein
MNTHEQINEMLVDYVLGELSHQQLSEVETHVAECRQCSGEVKRLEALLECTEQMRELSADEQMMESAKKALFETIVTEQQKEPTPRPKVGRAIMWRIIMKNRITKFAAAAVIVAAVLIGISVFNFNGIPAWADIAKAFNEVEDLHMHMIQSWPENNKIQHYLLWQRAVKGRLETYHYIDGVREDEETVVDNGIERLTLDMAMKKAQLSMPSLPDYSELDWWFHFVQFGEAGGYEIIPLRSESSREVAVYKIDRVGDAKVLDGKLWVDTKTMLPQRFSYSRIKQHLPDNVYPVVTFTFEISYSYDPIPDEFFSTEIPEGFTELPRLEPFSLSGTVIDENGYAVEGAIVYGACLSIGSKGELQTSVTDANGDFVLRAVDETFSKRLPGFLKAFKPDDPTRVAWTLFEEPKAKEFRSDFGGEIPGDPGELKFVPAYLHLQGGIIWRSADGIILQMEPAAKVTGTVIDDQGDPLPDVNVGLGFVLTGEDGRELVAKEGDESFYMSLYMCLYRNLKLCGPQIRTDDEGRYVMANLPRLWKNCYHGPYFEKKGYVFVSSDKLKADGPLEDQIVNVQMRKEIEKDVTISGQGY